MSNDLDRPTATYPTGYPAHLPVSYPTGWQADPAGYIPEGDPRLVQADATPTSAFPTRRSILLLRERLAGHSQHEGAPRPPQPAPQPAPPRAGRGGRGGQADAASLSHGGAGARAVYHTSRPAGRPAPSEQAPSGPLVDGRERRAWRRHLRAALAGTALAALVLTGLQLYALDGINDAREAARASRAARAARPTDGMSGQTTMPERAPENARTGIQPEWVTQDTGAPYDRTDASASPLDLPRCTTAPDTAMPCLAHVSADSTHAVVLEEDASLTGLDRQ